MGGRCKAGLFAVAYVPGAAFPTATGPRAARSRRTRGSGAHRPGACLQPGLVPVRLATGPGMVLAGFHVSGCRRHGPLSPEDLVATGGWRRPGGWRTSGRQRRLSPGGTALRASAAAARTAGAGGSSARVGRRIPSSVAAEGNAPAFGDARPRQDPENINYPAPRARRKTRTGICRLI